MKTNLLIALLCAITISFYSNNSLARNNLFYIQLGKGDDCKGYNICAVDLVDGANYLPNKVVLAIEQKDNKIQFAFLKSSVNSQLFLNYFSTGYFILDQDFLLPAHVIDAIQTKIKILKAGKYKITTSANEYIVVF